MVDNKMRIPEDLRQHLNDKAQMTSIVSILEQAFSVAWSKRNRHITYNGVELLVGWIGR